ADALRRGCVHRARHCIAVAAALAVGDADERITATLQGARTAVDRAGLALAAWVIRIGASGPLVTLAPCAALLAHAVVVGPHRFVVVDGAEGPIARSMQRGVERHRVLLLLLDEGALHAALRIVLHSLAALGVASNRALRRVHKLHRHPQTEAVADRTVRLEGVSIIDGAPACIEYLKAAAHGVVSFFAGALSQRNSDRRS